MSAPPLVSILIPAYNPRFFEPCLASAVAQTYADCEIIVADDSEGDAIRDIAEHRRDRDVRYLRNPERTPSPSVAQGSPHATV